MSGIAQKRPFASLVADQQDSGSSDALSPRQAILESESGMSTKTPRMSLTSAEKSFCIGALKTLMKQRSAGAFLEPVDPIAYNIPDYFEIVKNPMDLGTIMKKLRNGEYGTILEFSEDIQLMFDNCYLYNNAGDPVCCEAKKLEEVFRKCMKKAPASASIPRSPPRVSTPPAIPAPSVAPAPDPTPTIVSAPTLVSSPSPPPHPHPPTPPALVPSPAPSPAPSLAPSPAPSLAPSPAPSPARGPALAPSPARTETQTSTIAPVPDSVIAPTPPPLTPPPPAPPLSPPPAIPSPPKPLHIVDNYETYEPMDSEDLNIVSPEPFVSTTPKERSASISSVPETMSETEFKHCETVMKEMKKHKYHDYSWPFVQPVDAEAWGAIDYHDVVKEPMDMSTIEKKLYEHQYHNEDEFRSDFTLMFKNCFAYNPPDHLVHKNGKKFEEIFNNFWDKSLAKLSATKVKRLQELEKQKRELEKRLTKEETQGKVVEKKILVTTQRSEPKVTKITSDPDRPTILRLKLPIIPKPEIPSTPKEESPRETIPRKLSGLGLSKQAPQDVNRPKLALGEKPVSPKNLKAAEKKPSILQNQDSWLALAQKPKTQPSTPSAIVELDGFDKLPITPLEKVDERPDVPKEGSPATVKKEPVKTFDINDLYEKIHEESRIREQQKREERELLEKNEKARLEKEKKAREEQLEKDREQMQRMEIKKKEDQEERMANLERAPVDISAQKMTFQNYESANLSRDHDWREIYLWQRETVDYRHLPVPGFIRRSGCSLTELRRRLLSTRGRMETNRPQQDECEEDQGDSDMDVE